MSFVIDTPEGINAYRMLTLRRGLMLEISTGLKLSRGRTCYSIIKSEYNLRGNRDSVLRQFEAIMADAGIPFNA